MLTQKEVDAIQERRVRKQRVHGNRYRRRPTNTTGLANVHWCNSSKRYVFEMVENGTKKRKFFKEIFEAAAYKIGRGYVNR